MSRPMFSVVIPTINRAHLLKYALQSALASECDDYEIVVSDNNSSDNTREVVAACNNERVRYVNTGKTLSCTGNFEYGLNAARGEYIAFVADDEAHKPSSLPRLKSAIEKTGADIISFGRTPYFFPVNGDSDGGKLYVRPFTRRSAWVASEQLLRTTFSLSPLEQNYFGRALPLSVKSIVSRRVVAEVMKRSPAFHLPPTPDWSACVMMLCCVSRVLLLDEHLTIAGVCVESRGPEYRKTGKIDLETAAEMLKATEQTPLKKPQTMTNLVVGSILLGKNPFKPELDAYNLDLDRYARLIRSELEALSRNNVDVEGPMAELVSLEKKLISQRPLRQRLSVWLRGARRVHAAEPKAVNRLRQQRSPNVAMILGSGGGFSTIAECAARFDALTANIEPDWQVKDLYNEAYGRCEEVII